MKELRNCTLAHAHAKNRNMVDAKLLIIVSSYVYKDIKVRDRTVILFSHENI